MLILLNLRNHN